MKRISLFFIVTILAVGLTSALRSEEKEVVTESVPAINFPEVSYDAGECWEGDIVSHVFTFTNTGNAVLEIIQIRPSCGCTATFLSNDQIAPGASGEIQVSFNTHGYRGLKSQYVDVYSNAPASPTIQLTISAKVKVVAAFSPPSLQFGRVIKGRPAVQEISLVFDGEPIPVRELSIQPEVYSSRILKSDETGAIKIEVTLSPSAPIGQHLGTLTAQLDHPRVTSLTAHMFAMVEGVIQPSPRALFFNRSDQDGRTVHDIQIANYGKEPITIRSASIDIPEFQVLEIKTVEPGKEFTVTVRLRPESKPGRYSGNIKIDTAPSEGGMITVPLWADDSR